ncbi:MAG: hypothetical protein E6J91_12910 [Deltaproteobacteria bacterium]|nr:MAG: hypothetical protein E6J91_12910 [Deltaproteobacteria bacterium]
MALAEVVAALEERRAEGFAVAARRLADPDVGGPRVGAPPHRCGGPGGDRGRGGLGLYAPGVAGGGLGAGARGRAGARGIADGSARGAVRLAGDLEAGRGLGLVAVLEIRLARDERGAKTLAIGALQLAGADVGGVRVSAPPHGRPGGRAILHAAAQGLADRVGRRAVRCAGEPEAHDAVRGAARHEVADLCDHGGTELLAALLLGATGSDGDAMRLGAVPRSLAVAG